MTSRILLSAMLALWAGTATAQSIDFVTDTKLCGLGDMERQEQGMSFDGEMFYEIEYHCMLANPVTATTWLNTDTHVSPGYCEEPGALYPDVFVIRRFESEPGTLYVYQGDTGEPQMFYACNG